MPETTTKKINEVVLDREEYFGSLGQALAEDKDTYAKTYHKIRRVERDGQLVWETTNSRYFVRINSKSLLYDPGNLVRAIPGQPDYTFKEISPRGFESYRRYLETKNPAHLNVAQREFNNK